MECILFSKSLIFGSSRKGERSPPPPWYRVQEALHLAVCIECSFGPQIRPMLRYKHTQADGQWGKVRISIKIWSGRVQRERVVP